MKRQSTVVTELSTSIGEHFMDFRKKIFATIWHRLEGDERIRCICPKRMGARNIDFDVRFGIGFRLITIDYHRSSAISPICATQGVKKK